MLLAFLWKYRIATFRTLREMFYPEEPLRRAYDRLKKLEKGEFISLEKIIGTDYRAFTVGRRGYAYLVANVLPEPKTKAYRPHQHFHDVLAMAALLGEWLKTRPDSVRIVSEQEIANFNLMELPESVRKLSRRPDGIWIFSTGKEKKGIALEVEISAKTSDRYAEICAAYASEPFFEHVVWIVQSIAHGKRILASSDRHVGERRTHFFILRQDFEKDFWSSRAYGLDDCELFLADLLGRMAATGTSTSTVPGVAKGSLRGRQGVISACDGPLLNFDLYRTKSKASKPPDHAKIP
jgi:hypothetical protein